MKTQERIKELGRRAESVAETLSYCLVSSDIQQHRNSAEKRAESAAEVISTGMAVSLSSTIPDDWSIFHGENRDWLTAVERVVGGGFRLKVEVEVSGIKRKAAIDLDGIVLSHSTKGDIWDEIGRMLRSLDALSDKDLELALQNTTWKRETPAPSMRKAEPRPEVEGTW